MASAIIIRYLLSCRKSELPFNIRRIELKRISLRHILTAGLVLILLYAGIDLFWPFKSDLRQFDPIAMGKLETAMWRSYYSRQPVKLFFELAEVLRTQYHFPVLRSCLGAFYAARAAFRFQRW